MRILKEQCPKNDRSFITVTVRRGGVHFSGEYEAVSGIKSLISLSFLFVEKLWYYSLF